MVAITVCFFIFSLTALLANAGPFVPPAELCLPTFNKTELSGCIAMTNLEEECNNKPTEEEKLDCFCSQEMLSSYFDCESDVQLCLESHIFDSQFDVRISNWHTTCDSRLVTKTTTITTPSEPTLTTTYDFGACNRLYQSCISADYETRQCASKYLTERVEWTSCACQPRVYSLCSECQYNGNVSCKRTSAWESNIWGYSFCSSFWMADKKTNTPVQLTSLELGIHRPAVRTGDHSILKPAPTGFVTSIAMQTGGNFRKIVEENGQEEL